MLSTVYLLRGRFGKGPEGHSSVIIQLGVTHNMQSVLAHSAVPRDPFVNNCEKCSRLSQPGNLLCHPALRHVDANMDIKSTCCASSALSRRTLGHQRQGSRLPQSF